MPVPRFTDLVIPSSTAAGLQAETVEERLLTTMAMLASGQGPGGTQAKWGTP